MTRAPFSRRNIRFAGDRPARPRPRTGFCFARIIFCRRCYADLRLKRDGIATFQRLCVVRISIGDTTLEISIGCGDRALYFGFSFSVPNEAITYGLTAVPSELKRLAFDAFAAKARLSPGFRGWSPPRTASQLTPDGSSKLTIVSLPRRSTRTTRPTIEPVELGTRSCGRIPSVS